ncbi:hypothetical protein LA76x_2284 [Lysobacter antibioticus]|uniref:Peptidase MA superfamily protein n=1 Tax=Lysobacter antibioticus TaxID=84531 RepID=A0A0S2FA65_LYSAN|nr:hypothetical protein LA76x_2284 [Lysobacter antibioticus]
MTLFVRHSCLSLVLAVVAATAAAEAPDPEAAAGYIAERDAACRADAGQLWGEPLCAPLLLVDASTRSTVASQVVDGFAAKGEVFVGTLPKERNVANTAVDWNGTRWVMALWPLPEDAFERRQLLIHESWHAAQDRLGLPARSPTPAHLAEVEARIALRMEWRALAAALGASDDSARKRAIGDALVFRASRRAATVQARELENQLELNEGLAEYTGQRLAGRREAEAYAAAQLARHEGDDSFVRSFAYRSGPAYGLLLDRYGDWRSGLNPDSDLGELLAGKAGVVLPGDTATAAKQAGARYGIDAVRADEIGRDLARQRQAADWTAKLVDRPGLRAPFVAMNISFDPRALFPLPPHGTVYPTLRVSDQWGILEANAGALIDEAWSQARLPGPGRLRDSDGLWVGEGWTLKLNPGWTVSEADGGQILRRVGGATAGTASRSR